MKERFLWAGIVLVFLSWIGNYVYYQSKQLDQPIFLEHFYQGVISEEKSFTFYYLTNKQDPAEVTHVQIDGVDMVNVLNDGQGFGMWQDSSQPIFVQEFRHHYLKSVTLQFNKDFVQLNETKPSLSFETMEVFFNNNQSTIVAEIGKVNLYQDNSQTHVFDSRMSSSSNQHRSEEAMVTREPITIEEISIPFPKQLAGEVAVKVDLDQERLNELEPVKHGGEIPEWFEENRERKWEETPGVSIEEKKLFPIYLNENEWMHLYMYFHPEHTSYFEFGIQIKGKNDSGEPFEQIAPIIDHPSLEQEDIDEIIAGKGGRQ